MTACPRETKHLSNSEKVDLTDVFEINFAHQQVRDQTDKKKKSDIRLPSC